MTLGCNSPRKPSAQPLPPEIENRDRDRQCGALGTSRASRVPPTPAKPPETVRIPALVSSLSRLGSLLGGGRRRERTGLVPSMRLLPLVGRSENSRDFVRRGWTKWEFVGVGSPRGTLVPPQNGRSRVPMRESSGRREAGSLPSPRSSCIPEMHRASKLPTTVEQHLTEAQVVRLSSTPARCLRTRRCGA